jgi:hypothetical protein
MVARLEDPWEEAIAKALELEVEAQLAVDLIMDLF